MQLVMCQDGAPGGGHYGQRLSLHLVLQVVGSVYLANHRQILTRMIVGLYPMKREGSATGRRLVGYVHVTWAGGHVTGTYPHRDTCLETLDVLFHSSRPQYHGFRIGPPLRKR